MKHRKTAVVIGALLAASAAMTAAGAETRDKVAKAVDQAKAAVTPGEVVLTGRDMKTLHEGEDSAVYNVCVKADRNAGPVTVTGGSGTITLKPGDCHVVNGMRITATPEQPLTGAQRSTVTFEEPERGTK
jgi:hypothetical protein